MPTTTLDVQNPIAIASRKKYGRRAVVRETRRGSFKINNLHGEHPTTERWFPTYYALAAEVGLT